MNVDLIEKDFRSRVSERIELKPEGVGRFLVITPFRFDDGDHFGIVLKKENDRWILSDEANTLMHLSYEVDDQDIGAGNRAELIGGFLAGFSVENRSGELVIPVTEDRFGDALFSFIQALSKVSDISLLSRERVRSTFMEDFRAFLRSKVPAERLQFDWTDPEHDTHKRCPVDARVNSMPRPLFIYGLPHEDKVRDATISLLMFEKWRIPFQSMAVFEQQEDIQPKVMVRFTDVCEKTYSNLPDNKERIAAYLERLLEQTSRK